MNIISRLRRKLKSEFDLLDNKNLKNNLLNALPYWVGAFITGVTAVLYARLFAFAESWSEHIFKQAGWLFFFITPVAFVIAWLLVKKYSPYARGSGIPQVTASIELTNPNHYYKVSSLLGIKVIITKIISSLVMIFGGGVIGREGPTIQIAASIFKKINDYLPAWYPKISKRNMIVTGAAAGLASAFNTPLGGIVFAIEEITKVHLSYFKSELLTGVIIAGLTALHFLGPYLYLGYPQIDNIPSWIVAVIVPVALIAGIAGSGMGKIILYILRMKDRLKKNYYQLLYVIACGLIIASLAFFINQEAMGSGKNIMLTTLFTSSKHVQWYVPVLRMAGSIVSFSTGIAGGIFAPSLAAGASIGAVISGWFQLNSSETNLIILCGMVGFLTGITRSPFTSSILVLEMTNSHNIIFYLMVVALLANLVSSLITRYSFYDHLKDQYIHEIHHNEVQQIAIVRK